MSTFYTIVSLIGDKIHLRYIENGVRKQNKIRFQPSFFVPHREGTHVSLTGEKFIEIACESIAEYKEKLNYLDDLTREKASGNPKHEFDFISKYFDDEIYFEMDQINIAYLDIEVYANDGKFPEPSEAAYPINAISIRMHGITHVFALRYDANSTYDNDRKDITVKLYDQEEILLSEFMDFWKRSDIDIISGWNVSNFDITYICRRIEDMFGDRALNKLSPYGRVFSYTKRNSFDSKDLIYSIRGLSQMDYLALYK